MAHEEIRSRYEQLREELDRAYQASVWDTRRIDAIADAMQPLEMALAGQRATTSSDEEHGDGR